MMDSAGYPSRPEIRHETDQNNAAQHSPVPSHSPLCFIESRNRCESIVTKRIEKLLNSFEWQGGDLGLFQQGRVDFRFIPVSEVGTGGADEFKEVFGIVFLQQHGVDTVNNVFNQDLHLIVIELGDVAPGNLTVRRDDLHIRIIACLGCGLDACVQGFQIPVANACRHEGFCEKAQEIGSLVISHSFIFLAIWHGS